LREHKPAITARPRRVENSAKDRHLAKLVIHGDLTVAVSGHPQHGIRLIERYRERLLTHHVRAGGQRSHAEIRVSGRRRTDDHHLGPRRAQQAIDVVEGRSFTADDDRGAPVAIVNERMARAVWPGTTALGKCIRVGFDPSSEPGIAKGPSAPPATAPCREVVGVVRDWRRATADLMGGRRPMHYYLPFSQQITLPRWILAGPRAEGLLIRKQADVEPSTEQIRLAVTGGRTDLPFVDVQSYANLNGPRLSHWVIGTQLLLIFGALALATAALGLYAAFAHSVAERRQEIAVRLAVGASRQRILLMMLFEGTTVAGRGAINGVVVATLVGWAARSIIFDLSSPGLLVTATAMLIVLIVAVVATWLPARTASRAEPCELLRRD